jgi:hypothetical protein
MNGEHTVPPPTMLSQGEQSKEQEQRKRIEILKLWEIKIQPLDRGCVVHVGCKNFAFESLDAAMETVKQYVDNPLAVIKHYGFENYI